MLFCTVCYGTFLRDVSLLLSESFVLYSSTVLAVQYTACHATTQRFSDYGSVLSATRLGSVA